MADQTADVVVVGGGALGTSTAYHLARARLKVALVDRASILSGCSASTYAGVNVFFKETDAYMELSLRARALWANLEEQLGADLEYQRPGSIAHIVEQDSEWPDVLARVEEANQVPGVNMQVVRTPEAQELEPALPPWIQGVTFCPGDGQVNPFKLVAAYAEAAKRHGASIQPFTEVRNIEVKSGAVEAVMTSRGRISTPWVVNAAGLASPRIGRMVGVTIPVGPSHGQALTTIPVKPLVRYRLPGLLQKASGNLLVGPTHTYFGWSRDMRIGLIHKVASKNVRLFPFLKDVPVERIWTGMRPWPLDGLPILGPVAEVKGFLVATTHSGIGMAEMVGRIMADLVVKGETQEAIHHYRPDRFKGQRLSYAMQLFQESADFEGARFS